MEVQENKTMTKRSKPIRVEVGNPEGMTLKTIMTIYRNGILDHISMNRWKTRSNKPPKYPIAHPIIIPKAYTERVNASANQRAILVP